MTIFCFAIIERIVFKFQPVIALSIKYITFTITSMLFINYVYAYLFINVCNMFSLYTCTVFIVTGTSITFLFLDIFTR